MKTAKLIHHRYKMKIRILGKRCNLMTTTNSMTVEQTLIQIIVCKLSSTLLQFMFTFDHNSQTKLLPLNSDLLSCSYSINKKYRSSKTLPLPYLKFFLNLFELLLVLLFWLQDGFHTHYIVRLM